MSFYTSLGVTVSPDAAIYFLRFLKTLDEGPDYVYREKSGSISAVWEEHNHFDEYSGGEYNVIMDFLSKLNDEDYIYESVSEGCEPEVVGGFCFGFARIVKYELYGEPIDLDTVVSEGKRSRMNKTNHWRGDKPRTRKDKVSKRFAKPVFRGRRE